MRLLIALIISIFTFTSCLATAQSDESEIQILISKAPVTEAAAAAEGEELAIIFNWIIALACSGRTQDAYAAARKVKDKMGETDSMAAIAIGLGVAGKTDEALAVARKIEDINPSDMMIVEIFLRADRISEAVAEARKIKRISEQGRVLAEISKKLSKAGKTDAALSVANEIKGEAIDSFNTALGEIVVALARDGKSDEALATARKLKNEMDRNYTLETVVEELLKAEKVNEALTVSQEIKNEESRSHSLLNVVEALVDAGRVDEASAIASKIKGNYSLALSLGKVAAGLNKAGKKNESQKTLNEALSTARGIPEHMGRDKAFAYISVSLAQAEMTGEAMTVVRECKDGNEQAWAYVDIAEALAKQGKQDEAMKLARSIDENYGQRYEAITKIIHRLNEADKPGQKDIVKSASGFSSQEQLAVAEGLALAGKTEEAMAIARSIKGEDERSFALFKISQSLALSHSYKQARQAADLCPSPLFRLRAYPLILMSYATEKNPELKLRLEAENPRQ